MEKEQDSCLIQRLREGVKVKELFPHVYRDGKLYYEVSLRKEKIEILVELERTKSKASYAPIYLKIVHIYKLNLGNKNKVESMLIGKLLVFNFPKNLHKAQVQKNFSLTGTLTFL